MRDTMGDMGEWRTLDSPRLKIPFEMRELTLPTDGGRRWEVQELRGGSVFIVTYHKDPKSTPKEGVLQHAVCVAVEESLLTPPDKEPGETYDVIVTDDHLAEAKQIR